MNFKIELSKARLCEVAIRAVALIFVFFAMQVFMEGRTAFGVETRDTRLDFSYARIGKFAIQKKSAVEDFKSAYNQYSKNNQGENLERLANANLASLALSNPAKFVELVEFGKKVIFKAIKKTISPICKTLKACQNSCRLEVAGDLMALLTEANPEFFLVESVFQKIVIDKVLPEIKEWCSCS